MKRKANLREEISPAEKIIIEFLQANKISFEREVGFNTCKNPETNKLFIFDFYFPQYNLIIEYDGQEHFTNEKVQKHDKLKNEWCEKNKIQIIRLNKKVWGRIPYTLTKIFSDKEPKSINKPAKTDNVIQQLQGSDGTVILILMHMKNNSKVFSLNELDKIAEEYGISLLRLQRSVNRLKTNKLITVVKNEVTLSRLFKI